MKLGTDEWSSAPLARWIVEGEVTEVAEVETEVVGEVAEVVKVETEVVGEVAEVVEVETEVVVVGNRADSTSV